MVFLFLFFFFNDTATTEIYTLSLHDALPIDNVAVRRTRPVSGSVRPVRMRSSVLLPSPLRPTTPMTSPRPRPRLTPTSRDRVPYAIETRSALIRFAIGCGPTGRASPGGRLSPGEDWSASGLWAKAPEGEPRRGLATAA